LIEKGFTSDHLNSLCGNALWTWMRVYLLLFQVAMRGLDILGALRMKSRMVAWKLNRKVFKSYFIFLKCLYKAYKTPERCSNFRLIIINGISTIIHKIDPRISWYILIFQNYIILFCLFNDPSLFHSFLYF